MHDDPDSPRHGPKAALAAILTGLLLVTAAAHLPSLGNGFTNFDDHVYVTGNPLVRDLTWRTIPRLFTGIINDYYHPLTLVSHALDIRLFGMEAAGHHAHNLALHLLNTLLVFPFCILLGASRPASLAAAFLFGVHPLTVESVSWIASRKNLLSTLYLLAALCLFLLHRRRGSRERRWYWAAVALVALSLLSKPMAVTFPLLILLINRHLGGPPRRELIRELVPFLILSATAGALTLVGQEKAFRVGAEVPLWDAPFIAAHGVLFYLLKIVFPLGLSALYPYPARVNGHLPPAYLAAPFVLALALAAAWRLSRGRRLARFGILFFLVALLPVIQLVPVGFVAAADRFTYVPSLGLFLAAGASWAEALAKRRGKVLPRLPAAALLPLVVVIFSVATWHRSFVWKESLTLWTDVIRKYPGASVAWAYRGDARLKRGEWPLALEDYDRALGAANPGMKTASLLHNKGVVLQNMGRYREAADAFGLALAQEVEVATFVGRGMSLLSLGETGAALGDFTSALALEPADYATLVSRGDAYLRLGMFAEAAADFSSALKIRPQDTFASYQLGNALASAGDHAAAEEVFAGILAGSPGLWEVWFNRGNARLRQGRWREAIADYTEALKRSPGQAAVLNNRGTALMTEGEIDSALRDFESALAIDPSHAGALANRARALASGRTTRGSGP